MISTASIIILGRTGVVSRGGSGSRAGFSSSSSSSSSTTVGTFFVVRDRVALVVDFEGPALAFVMRVVVRVEVFEESLVEGGLVEGSFVEGGFFDGGFT